MRRAALVIGAALLALLLAAALRVGLEFRSEPVLTTPASQAADVVARGEYLARVGHCAGCHTAPGEAAYGGGRALPTPFGTLYASNLTPHEDGLAGWNNADFWRALHHGRSRDGRLLYPAFPYSNLTLVTRADSDALFAYLRSLPPVARPNQPHTLRFPYDQPLALAAWRALYFRPAAFEPQPQRSADWNRGAYLVRSLGHCSACHAPRNALGATRNPLDLEGGMVPLRNWYAPALNDAAEAGVADWPLDEIVSLLRTGIAPRGTALGPMADVVKGSSQHWNAADLRAVAIYLKELPQRRDNLARPVAPPTSAPVADAPATLGARLYERHCADCHGAQGQGKPPAYPALAGNRTLTMASPVNLTRIVLGGGFAPSTAANPRPYGMPPFATVLSDAEIASLLGHLRSSWGHDASQPSVLDVNRLRGGSAP